MDCRPPQPPAPEGGKQRRPRAAARLPAAPQVTAEGEGATEDNEKCGQMVYGANLPLLSPPRPAELPGMEGEGRR